VPACRPPSRGENRCAGTNRRAPRPVPLRRRGKVCAGWSRWRVGPLPGLATTPWRFTGQCLWRLAPPPLRDENPRRRRGDAGEAWSQEAGGQCGAGACGTVDCCCEREGQTHSGRLLPAAGHIPASGGSAGPSSQLSTPHSGLPSGRPSSACPARRSAWRGFTSQPPRG